MSKMYVCGDIHGNYKGLVQAIERSPFKPQEDTLISLGDLVDGGYDSYEVVEYLSSLPDCILINGNHDCLDEDTELFTDSGWKKYNDILITDKVVGLLENGKSVWQSIDNIIIKDSDHINNYKNTKVDYSCTDNHRVLYKTSRGEYEYKLFKDIKSSDRLGIPLASEGFSNEIDFDITDSEIKLTAWIITDGYLSDKFNNCSIYQSKEGNLDYIRNILKECGINYNETSKNTTEKVILGKIVKNQKIPHQFYIPAKDVKYIKDKLLNSKKELPKFINNLSHRQLDLFLSELIKGDGSQYNNKSCFILYGTKSFLDSIQGYFNLCGYSANITQSNRGDYRLNISTNTTNTIRQDLNKVNRLEGNFKVWCLQVKTTNFLVRRNNKSYFTGNCWFKHWIRYGVNPVNWLHGQHLTAESYIRYVKRELGEDRMITPTHKGYVTNLIHSDIPKKHRDFLNSGVNYFIDVKNNCYVHGGFNRFLPINKQRDDSIYYWDRDFWLQALHASNGEFKIEGNYNTVFIGHTSTTNWKTTKPMLAANVWNLDTGAGTYGKVTIMDVNTYEYWQSDLFKELY